jgi:hypothetical protein
MYSTQEGIFRRELQLAFWVTFLQKRRVIQPDQGLFRHICLMDELGDLRALRALYGLPVVKPVKTPESHSQPEH